MSELPLETICTGHVVFRCPTCAGRWSGTFNYWPSTGVAAWDLDDAARRVAWCQRCEQPAQVEHVSGGDGVTRQLMELYEVIYQLPVSGAIEGYGPYATREAAEARGAEVTALGGRVLRIGLGKFIAPGPPKPIYLHPDPAWKTWEPRQ
jgi:hypothetical protein